MTQAALPFDHRLAAAPLAWADAGGTGHALGRDHARYRLTPPVEHLQPGNPLRLGWEAGRAAFGSARTLRPTPAVRQWLQLRTDAWLRGRAFEGLQVTPALLRRLEVAHCPVTRTPLAGDGVVVRCNRDAGYAAGNLALVSPAVQRALAGRDCHDALAVAQRLQPGEVVEGLDADAWRRLAVLASFATPLPHAQAAALPLCVLPPPRVRLLNAAQALQLLVTLPFAGDGYARRIESLVALAPDDAARHALRALLHTLLARHIAAGRDASRHALEDLWRDALVQRRWQRLAARLSEADCERIVEAAQRRDVVPRMRWLPREQATDGWALATRGHVAAPAQRIASTVAWNT